MYRVERPSWMSVAVAHAHELIGKLDPAGPSEAGFFLDPEEGAFRDGDALPFRRGQRFGLETAGPFAAEGKG